MPYPSWENSIHRHGMSICPSLVMLILITLVKVWFDFFTPDFLLFLLLVICKRCETPKTVRVSHSIQPPPATLDLAWLTIVRTNLSVIILKSWLSISSTVSTFPGQHLHRCHDSLHSSRFRHPIFTSPCYYDCNLLLCDCFVDLDFSLLNLWADWRQTPHLFLFASAVLLKSLS